MRTKRARRWRKVLFHRSTWAVSPVSFPTAGCCSSGITAASAAQKDVSQCPCRYPCGIASHSRWHVRQAPITHRISDHLSRLAAESHPHPGVVCFFEHKRPELVQFQGRRSGMFGIRCKQGGLEGRKLSYFFLIQLDMVVPETPKVRVRPRRLLRS